ncbi:Exopolyphosphatase [Saitoella coloradoensis]
MPSISSFLSAAKNALLRPAPVSTRTVALVTGNESADLDSCLASITYAYMATQASPSTVHVPLLNFDRADFALKPELLHVFKDTSVSTDDLVCLDDLPASLNVENWVLVDHNAPTGRIAQLAGAQAEKVVGIIDHHVDEGLAKGASPRVIDVTGSCTTLVVNYFRSLPGLAWPAGEDGVKLAKMAITPILIDCSNLRSSKTTPHDVEAVAFLRSILGFEKGFQTMGATDSIDEWYHAVDDAKRDVSSLSVRDLLRRDYKEWQTSTSATLGISSCVVSVTDLNNKDGKWWSAIKEWSQERKLDVYALMASFNVDGKHRRELVVYAANEKWSEIGQLFKEKHGEEFDLKKWKGEKGVVDAVKEDERAWPWRQKNAKASRKQIAPALRQTMEDAGH